MTTPAPDLPDWALGQQPVTVPTPLGTFVVPSGGQTVPVDVSAYSSVFIAGKNNSTRKVFAVFVDETSGLFDEAVGSSPVIVQAGLVPVSAKWFYLLDISNTGNSSFEVFGYGRPVPDPRVIVAGHATEPWLGSIPSQLWTVGEVAPVNPNNDATFFQGLAFLYFRCEAVTGKGILQALTIGANAINLADTAEGFAATNTGNAVSKLCALPANVDSLQFVSEAAATFAVQVQLTPAY